jgi:hypothetical protein
MQKAGLSGVKTAHASQTISDAKIRSGVRYRAGRKKKGCRGGERQPLNVIVSRLRNSEARGALNANTHSPLIRSAHITNAGLFSIGTGKNVAVLP